MLCYIQNGRATLEAFNRNHRWFRGEFNYEDMDSGVILLGWFPHINSPARQEWVDDCLRGSAVPANDPTAIATRLLLKQEETQDTAPTKNRKIRITDADKTTDIPS